MESKVLRKIEVIEKCEDTCSRAAKTKDHVEVEGSLGISELFGREERRKEIGNFMVERVIATTLTRVPVVVEGQEVKAVLDHGVGSKDGNTREEIPEERLEEWRPVESNWELEAGHGLRKGGTIHLHMETCDKDITEIFVESSVDDLLLVADMEEKDITEKTRKGVEFEIEVTYFEGSRIVDEDYIQSFS